MGPDVIRYIQKVLSESPKYWGKIVFDVQNGEIVKIERNEIVKIGEIKK